VNILAFFAHPDDETMLGGATLALVSRLANLHILCATRGEGGETGEPPLCPREDLGAVRSEELSCAVNVLGAASLDFLPYMDPTVGPDNTLYPFSPNEELLAQQVADAVIRRGAHVLISHGADGEYGHPAHKLCHRACLGAIRLLGAGAPLFYTIQSIFANHPRPRLANRSEPAHLILDLESLRAVKTKAALCHRTQHALFVRAASQETGRPYTVPEIIMTLESVHRVSPPLLPGQPLVDPFAALLRSSGWTRENPDLLFSDGSSSSGLSIASSPDCIDGAH
jgi:LmbE family N-acetylglucosaminyl deacetylase